MQDESVTVCRAGRTLLVALALFAPLVLHGRANAQAGCTNDISGDGVVNGADLAALLSSWGSCAGCVSDVSGDGVVNGVDLSFVLTAWGATCAPTVSGVSPFAGSTVGGNTVTIAGGHLASPLAVSFGGAAASVVGSTRSSVTVVVPPRPAGSVSVTVTTQGGSATLGSGYTYFAAPSVSGVSPAAGPLQGGTVVTITGAGFGPNLGGLPPTVMIGGVAATGVQVVSQSTLTAVAPANSAGTKPVSVTTPGGTATLANAFTYYPATGIASVTPASGPLQGGSVITITGNSFYPPASVTVGGVAAASVTILSPTTLTAVTPAGTLGAKPVTVTTPSGSATLQNAFSYSSYTVLQFAPDPAVVTNAALRNAITATGLPWRVRDNASQVEMLLVPPGSFQMGCSPSLASACLGNESPVHAVSLTNAFYLGRYELTQSQWVARMSTNPSQFQGATYPDAANRPVEQVAYGNIQMYLIATGLRLPTEAEWEYACRAGTVTAFHSGSGFASGTNDDGLLGQLAWWVGNNGASGSANWGTKAVGQKSANALGFHDMLGNVWEFVFDVPNTYSAVPQTNPVFPPGQGSPPNYDRVFRGGGWSSASGECRVSRRDYGLQTTAANNIGLRVARNP
jgi:formylglycine-generating enzyme required for sulfatase activity